MSPLPLPRSRPNPPWTRSTLIPLPHSHGDKVANVRPLWTALRWGPPASHFRCKSGHDSKEVEPTRLTRSRPLFASGASHSLIAWRKHVWRLENYLAQRHVHHRAKPSTTLPIPGRSVARIAQNCSYGCTRDFYFSPPHSGSRLGLANFANASGLAQGVKPVSRMVSICRWSSVSL